MEFSMKFARCLNKNMTWKLIFKEQLEHTTIDNSLLNSGCTIDGTLAVDNHP